MVLMMGHWTSPLQILYITPRREVFLRCSRHGHPSKSSMRCTLEVLWYRFSTNRAARLRMASKLSMLYCYILGRYTSKLSMLYCYILGRYTSRLSMLYCYILGRYTSKLSMLYCYILGRYTVRNIHRDKIPGRNCVIPT